MGLSGAVTRSEGPAVKAFSGKGQALGSRPEKVNNVHVCPGPFSYPHSAMHPLLASINLFYPQDMSDT